MLVFDLPSELAATPFTVAWFGDLPEFMQTDDRAAGFPLLKFMRLIGDQGDGFASTYRRIDFTPVDEGGTPGDASDLVDPDTADPAWLPYSATLVGARLGSGLTVAQQRDAIRYSPAGFRAGQKSAVADAAQSVLTNTRYARVVPNRTESGPGTQWDLLIVTRLTETPDIPAVLAAVIAQRVKPAGVILHHLAYSATVGQVMTAHTTVGAYAGQTIGQVMETGAGL